MVLAKVGDTVELIQYHSFWADPDPETDNTPFLARVGYKTRVLGIRDYDEESGREGNGHYLYKVMDMSGATSEVFYKFWKIVEQAPVRKLPKWF